MNYENFVSAVESLALKYQRMNPGMYVSINHTAYGLELTCMLKEQMRRQWVDLMLTEYGEKFEAWSEVILCDENRKIMVVRFEDRWREREVMVFPSVLPLTSLMKKSVWPLLLPTSVNIPFPTLCKIFVGRNSAPLFLVKFYLDV